MPDPVKNTSLTQKDIMLIGMILIGTTKLIHTRKLVDEYAERYAKAQSHLQVKSLVRTFVITNLDAITRNKTMFRPSDVRDRLSEQWKGIAPAELRRVLEYLVKINAITSVRCEDVPARKWGRPTDKELEQIKAGRKSFYSVSDYYDNLRKVLTKPKAIRLIYSLLYHSGLLYRHLIGTTMVAYYVLKHNDVERARHILMAVGLSPMIRDFELESQYDKVRNMRTDKDLRQLAEQRARSRIERGRGSDHISLYLQRGLAFGSQVQSTKLTSRSLA
jgi:hypothetical protein